MFPVSPDDLEPYPPPPKRDVMAYPHSDLAIVSHLAIRLVALVVCETGLELVKTEHIISSYLSLPARLLQRLVKCNQHQALSKCSRPHGL